MLKKDDDIYPINSLIESMMAVVKPSLREGRDFSHESLIFIEHCHTINEEFKNEPCLAQLIDSDETKWRLILQRFIASIQTMPQSEIDLLTDRLILAYLKMDPLLIDVIQRIKLKDYNQSKKSA